MQIYQSVKRKSISIILTFFAIALIILANGPARAASNMADSKETELVFYDGLLDPEIIGRDFGTYGFNQFQIESSNSLDSTRKQCEASVEQAVKSHMENIRNDEYRLTSLQDRKNHLTKNQQKQLDFSDIERTIKNMGYSINNRLHPFKTKCSEISDNSKREINSLIGDYNYLMTISDQEKDNRNQDNSAKEHLKAVVTSARNDYILEEDEFLKTNNQVSKDLQPYKSKIKELLDSAEQKLRALESEPRDKVPELEATIKSSIRLVISRSKYDDIPLLYNMMEEMRESYPATYKKITNIIDLMAKSKLDDTVHNIAQILQHYWSDTNKNFIHVPALLDSDKSIALIDILAVIIVSFYADELDIDSFVFVNQKHPGCNQIVVKFNPVDSTLHINAEPRHSAEQSILLEYAHEEDWLENPIYTFGKRQYHSLKTECIGAANQYASPVYINVPATE